MSGTPRDWGGPDGDVRPTEGYAAPIGWAGLDSDVKRTDFSGVHKD